MSKSVINKKYQSLYTSDKRYHVITGGRGSGKSHSTNEYLLRLTYEPKHGILFTRYTMTSAHISIIPEFLEAIERLEVKEHFKVTKDKIVNILTGSFIIFRGIKSSSGSNTANLKSLAGITTFVVEEAEDLLNDEVAFDKVDDSVRTKGVKNRVILILNPSIDEHWIYQRWFRGYEKYIKIDGFDVLVSDHPRINHIHTTYLDAKKYLSDDWLQKAEDVKHNNKEKYLNNYLGGWKDKQDGAIYTNWELGEFDTTIPFGFGQDWGSKDEDALIRCAIDSRKGILYVHEEIYENNLTTNELINKTALITRGSPIVGDSSGRRTIHDFEMAGVGVIPVRKFSGSILEGIRRVQDLKIVVTPSSRNVIRELKNYIWSNRSGQVPVDAFNHSLDAIRYYVLEFSREHSSVFVI